jgi:hypothetical protein
MGITAWIIINIQLELLDLINYPIEYYYPDTMKEQLRDGKGKKGNYKPVEKRGNK